MGGLNDQHTPKARLLGAELRELRKEAGLNGRELAARLDITQTTVSRYESGKRTAPVDYVARVAGLVGLTGSRYNELIAFAQTASEPNMVADSRTGLHRHLLDLAEFERAATRVVHVAPLVIPGLVQTRRYAREMMVSLPPQEVDVRVELRMARGITPDSTKNVEVILREQVLHSPFGGPVVLAEQLRHIVDLYKAGAVTVRILPADLQRWTLADNGAFVLFEFDKAAPIVHLEHFRGPTFLYDEGDVEAYRSELTTLLDVAMSPESAAELMATVAQQLEGAQR